MEHKITIRLSDKEYYILEEMSKHYKNNKSKTLREVIKNYAKVIQLMTPTRRYLEELKKRKKKEEDELPFT